MSVDFKKLGFATIPMARFYVGHVVHPEQSILQELLTRIEHLELEIRKIKELLPELLNSPEISSHGDWNDFHMSDKDAS